MRTDDLGFSYPVVKTSQCIECGLCRHTCPFIKPSTPLLPQACYAAIHKDERQRLRSSSGGVFIALARNIIDRGGVVFGAVFTEDWSVIHTYAEVLDDVFPMMGSKYVQSDTNETFRQAKFFLENGREVMFTGTPCQIAGLKNYLKKDYPGLLAVEIICHGVPAPAVWKSYLTEILHERGHHGKSITNVSFRSKRSGWKKYSFELSDASGTLSEIMLNNQYMKAFLQNLILRPSCYACKVKSGISQADLTIGDFWGIDKTGIVNDDDKGTSCVICRSEKGLWAIENHEQLVLKPADYHVIYQGNPCIEKSVPLTFSALQFRNIFPRRGFFRTMNKFEHPSVFYRGVDFLFRVLKSAHKLNHV